MTTFVSVNKKKMYDAQVQELDFASPKAPDIINGLVCRENEINCIPKVFE